MSIQNQQLKVENWDYGQKYEGKNGTFTNSQLKVLENSAELLVKILKG